jgi:hypothetical protein
MPGLFGYLSVQNDINHSGTLSKMQKNKRMIALLVINFFNEGCIHAGNI